MVLKLLSSVTKEIQHETTFLDLNEISLKYYIEEMCQYKVTYDSARNSGYNIIRNQTILIWVDICVQVLQRKEKAMITIITNIYLEFMLLPVYNNSCDLLVHENENGDQQSRDSSRKVHPPGVFSKWRHKPTTVRTCWLEEERKQSNEYIPLCEKSTGEIHF